MDKHNRYREYPSSKSKLKVPEGTSFNPLGFQHHHLESDTYLNVISASTDTLVQPFEQETLFRFGNQTERVFDVSDAGIRSKYFPLSPNKYEKKSSLRPEVVPQELQTRSLGDLRHAARSPKWTAADVPSESPFYNPHRRLSERIDPPPQKKNVSKKAQLKLQREELARQKSLKQPEETESSKNYDNESYKIKNKSAKFKGSGKKYFQDDISNESLHISPNARGHSSSPKNKSAKIRSRKEKNVVGGSKSLDIEENSSTIPETTTTDSPQGKTTVTTEEASKESGDVSVPIPSALFSMFSKPPSQPTKKKEVSRTMSMDAAPMGNVFGLLTAVVAPEQVTEQFRLDSAVAAILFGMCRKREWNQVESQLRNLERNRANAKIDTSSYLLGMVDEENGWTPLMYTVKSNKISIADRMIELGVDVNARNNDTLTALHLAALEGTDDMIRFLVKSGADASLITEQKQNVLHLACTRQKETVVNILDCLMKVTPDKALLDVNEDGKIPLFLAIHYGSLGASHKLLENLCEEQLKFKGGEVHDTALHLATINKKQDIARIFMDKGADVNATNDELQTPMHIACAQGNDRLVKQFYIYKANANLRDKYDRSAISLAVMNGHTQIVDLLVDKFKVSVFERSKDGSTLVHIASLHGHPETAMALFKRGVPLQMPNKGGARSLHIAAKHGHAAMVVKLLEKGEDVDALTVDNYTALHIAVENERPNVVETLLGYGTQVHIKGGKAKETALHIAARTANGERCAQMLLKSGADPHLTMENGETPLHIASKHGKIATIRLLLQEGANSSEKSNEGLTPLHLACQSGHLDVVRVLLTSIRKDQGDANVTLYINQVTNRGESSLHYAAKLPRSLAIIAHSVAEMTTTTAALGIAARAAIGRNKDVTGVGAAIAKVLLDNGASVYLLTRDTKESPFHYCAWGGNNHILLEMLSRTPAAKIQQVLNKAAKNGWSPLLTSCHRGHRDVVKTLLDNLARVDIFDHEGHSGLHLSAAEGFQDLCELLLSKGAFINAKSRVGLTALHVAAEKGFTELCECLIKNYGATVDIVTLQKQTPMHLAAKAGKLDVCRLLMELKADPDASDEHGQKPIHLAAENNHSDVIELFLKLHSPLASSSTKDGDSCAHLAAMQGSVSVLEQLMKFDKHGVINARNKTTDATALQIAAEGGHAELVKALLDAGADPSDENRAGYTAVHLAAKNGHTQVIEAFRNSKAIALRSQKMGLTALHIAAFYGQTVCAHELMQVIPSTDVSEAPISVAKSFIKELGTEAGFTPLHMAAFSGEENVVRLLLNSQGVRTDAQTSSFGFNPLHLAAKNGHLNVVGLMLSRSSELLESKDATGKTSLHIAAIHGHVPMCEFLSGQGAEIDSIDSEKMTPLHCASKAGHVDVVKFLTERGADSLARNKDGHSPIWFADVQNHNPVLFHLMAQEHDTYSLIEDHEFVFNLTICGKKSNNEPLNEFVLVSPAPVDVAAKLARTLLIISGKEKERERDIIAASKHCEGMTSELLVLAVSAESAEKILNATDRNGIKLLDVLIDNEQKEVVAHTVVQRYLHEVWVGNLSWASWKLMLLFVSFIFLPPVWIVFSIPFCHKYHKIPIVKFMSYLTSHIHIMILLCLICVTPIYPVFPIRQNLFPFSFEWIFMVYMTGLIVSEVSHPSDKSGLGWTKIVVIICGIIGIIIHAAGFLIEKNWYGNLLYIRNQMFALATLLATVQILDFLSFHYLFGPWTIIIGNLMKDLARFLAVLAIFMLGFSLVMSTLNLPVFDREEEEPDPNEFSLFPYDPYGVSVTPLVAFDLLFFGLFGQTAAMDMQLEKAQPPWTLILFKLFFAIFMLVTVVVLINLLIAMMSDTYQRIVAQSDIEWKYGLAKLIGNYHRTAAPPTPINLFIQWIVWITEKWQCKKAPKGRKQASQKKPGPKVPPTVLPIVPFNRLKPNERWKNLYKRIKINNQDKFPNKPRMSINMSQLSQLLKESKENDGESMHRIEDATDWPSIAQKYRSLIDRK